MTTHTEKTQTLWWGEKTETTTLLIFHRFINPKIYATRAEAVEDSLQHREEEELADDVVSTLINSCGDIVVCVCEGDWQRQHNTATLLIDLHLFWHNRNISTLMEAERDNESCERGRQLGDYKRTSGLQENFYRRTRGLQENYWITSTGELEDYRRTKELQENWRTTGV